MHRPHPKPFVVCLLLATGTIASPAAASAQEAPATSALDPAGAIRDEERNVLHYDLLDLGLEGQGWSELAAPYDRLPARAEALVRPPVWALSRDSSGLAVRFVSDARTLRMRWVLNSPDLDMVHMPATGVSGVDLYVRTEDRGWRWLSVGRPSGVENDVELVNGLPEGRREYMVYLPLYSGIVSASIGIPAASTISRAPERPEGRRKPILFYGTSITQGGCASRPGMVHTAILGRWFDRPVINLGFSGNGRMDPELGPMLGELDPAVFVVDCLPNMNGGTVAERTEPLVRALRDARPDTPILLVEDRSFENAWLRPQRQAHHAASRKALREAYERLIEDGVGGLYYLEGEDLLGDDSESTVDGSHPTDLGFRRQAERFLEALEPLLGAAPHSPR